MKKMLKYWCEPMTKEMYWHEHSTNLWKTTENIDIRRARGTVATLRTKRQVVDMVTKNPQLVFNIDLVRNTKSGRKFVKNWVWYSDEILPETLATAHAYKKERNKC